MLKKILKIAVLIVIFVVSVLLIGYFTNSSEEDLTTQISAATLPVVRLESEDQKINALFGHKSEMQAKYMRKVITPAAQDGSIPFEINTFGNDIEKVSFELMRTDGSFYVSGQEITDIEEHEGQVSGTFQMETALEDGREYILHIMVDTRQQSKISYYSRVIQKEELRTSHYVTYAREFSEKSFDKDAAESLRSSLETSETGRNSSFSYANIKSTLEHVAWERLNPQLVSDMDINVLEIDGETASVEVSYQISTESDGETSYYNVTDFYLLRYSSEKKTYVLSFERNTGQIFDTSQQVLTSNGIVLGIVGSDVNYITDETGSIVVFEQEVSVYCYNKTTNKLSIVFSYTSDSKNDIRNTNQDYEIKFIDMDEAGNTKFIVHGYMNRGNHEGETGILAYYYDEEKNSVEEKIFIPSSKSSDVLKDEVDQLAYISSDDIFYLYYAECIYQIDLKARSKVILQENISRDQFVVSDRYHYLAWQETGQVYEATELKWLDMDSGKEQIFTVGSLERMKPLGFVNADLIYGIAENENVETGIAGNLIFPMHNIKVQEPNGTTPKDRTQPEGMYVTDIEILEDMVRLVRIERSGDGYSSAALDSLTSNVETENVRVEVNGFTTDQRKREYRLKFETTIKETNPVIRQPSYVAFEVSRDMVLSDEEQTEQIYYAYGYGRFCGGYQSVSKAIEAIEELRGQVVSSHGTVIWKRGGAESASISEMREYKVEDGMSAMAACLQSIFDLEGRNVDAQQMLDSGLSAVEILEEGLGTTAILIEGLTMNEEGRNQALQLISKGSPVIAMTNSRDAVLITGYDSVNITVMDPQEGIIRRMGKNDSKALFESAGNIYVSYER